MPQQKTITIVGATGTQGSSVARTFLSLPNWHVRCITRDTTSPRATSLSTLGATIIQADLNDLTSLKTAFANTHAIFVNTDFWGLYRATPPSSSSSRSAFAQEIQQGKNAALAASTIPTLERYIYSALGPMKKHSKGKYPHSYHWDSKAEIVEFIETELPELAKRTSFVYLGVYVSNPLFMPRVDHGGKLKFVIPLGKRVKIPVMDAGMATGGFVRALVEEETAGVKLLACCGWLEVREMVDVWARVTGREAEVVEVTPEWMRRELGIPMEVLDAPAYIEEFGYMSGLEGVVEPGELRGRGLERWSFEDWLRGQDWEGILKAGMEELDGVKKEEVV
ncbi:putative hscarg dehydrogenase [Aspergillus sclerotiicarbonarius CBS 121057]|uniref:Putative hscarg dehydrogenase n=1 Tax=Aspergillus sclerotiicarbonarius (strain CBS 121057 / IBT 28362) TaxID=1448318 RepID=A0A319DS88_ASPSB|nr:putative hscarg dehydrogenase [Aspergillus sclerotiicarbonarius CBS 121057]